VALLWLKLNKLFYLGMRLAAWFVVVLAVLNYCVGGMSLLIDSDSSTDKRFEPTRTSLQGLTNSTQLLHLQVLGFIHLHENLDGSGNQQHLQHSKAGLPPGVTEVDLTETLGRQQLERPAYFDFYHPYLSQIYPAQFSMQGSGSGAGGAQLLVSDALPVDGFDLIPSLNLVSRLQSPDPAKAINPFLSVPQRPPVS